MPYFVFAVGPFSVLKKLAEFDAFKDASVHAKALRQAPQADVATRIKVMFADTPLAAEDLLLQVREAPPDGDD